MKNLFIALSIIWCVNLPAQVINLDATTTRAVVIGISDYQNLPDLRFADRDAEAFADWLRSPAGGFLDGKLVALLTNKKATTGQLIGAFDWLIDKSNPGDRAIIYFSGHSDVERATKFQRGFLLTYDSPPSAYQAGAYALIFLQDVITTLSDAGVQVVMISDACRAGKLAGSEQKGTEATSAEMAKRFANEVKILSCQPDEFSLEGEQWGGGRGCFSYHLIDGLAGLADNNSDLTVNLLEIGSYLQEWVPKETAPLSQIPITVGDLKTPLAFVNDSLLTIAKKGKSEQLLALKPIETKGMEELVFEELDTNIQEMYRAFMAAIEKGDLMSSPSGGKSADDYYRSLIDVPELAELHSFMRRNFAAALMDESQQAINLLMQTDPLFADNVWAMPLHLDRAPAYLNRAAGLLGEEHYIYKSLKAKEYYFKGKNYNLENFPNANPDSLERWKAMEYLAGLTYDENAPYLLQALLFDIFSLEGDRRKSYADKLEEIAPSWALGQYTLGLTTANYLGESERSIEHYQKAIALDSNFLSSYNWIAWPYEFLGQKSEGKKWRSKYVERLKARILADSSTATPSLYTDLGNALWRLGRNEEAKEALLLGEKLSKGQLPTIYGNLFVVHLELGEYEKAIESHMNLYRLIGNKGYGLSFIDEIYFSLLNSPEKGVDFFKTILADDSTNAVAYHGLGRLLHLLKRYDEAEEAYKKAVRFDNPTNPIANYDTPPKMFLGELYMDMKRREEGQKLLEEFIALYPNPVEYNSLYLVGRAYLGLGNLEAMEETTTKAVKSTPDDVNIFYAVAALYALASKEKDALESLEKVLEKITYSYAWILIDDDWDNIRDSEGFKALMRKYFPEQFKD